MRTRRTWLFRLGLASLLLLLVLGGLAARSALQRAEHQRLRQAEVGRAPVVGPRRAAPVRLPDAPSAPSCVHGRVLDHGAPVGGMQVSLSAAPFSLSGDCPCPRPAKACGCRDGLAQLASLPRAGLVEAVQSVLSDPSGHFELCGLEGEGLRLIWGEHLDGRLALPPPEQSPFARPGATLELQVVPFLLVNGVVLAEQTPVPHATVLAFTTPPLFVRSFTTDARGRFETRLPQAVSHFVISAPGFAPQRLEQQFSPQQVLVLRLLGQGELTVRALFEERPVSGAEVVLGSEPAVLTDAQGLAHLSIPTSSRFEVQVTSGELLGISSVTLLEGKPRQVDVVLTRGVRVRGVVLDEQGPHPGAQVRGFTPGKPVSTDLAGHFTSGLLLPSRAVHPVAFADGCADSEYRTVELEGRQLELTLTLACLESVNGSVVDAEGQPIEGAGVFLDSLDHRQSATTDATGTFRFHQPQGAYRLKVIHERYRAHEQPLQVPARDVTIVLDAGGSLSGRVVNGAGAGVAAAEVTVVPAVLDQLMAELEGGNTRVSTDADGRFEISGLLAGRLAVSASADSQGTVVSDVVVLQPGEHREGLLLTLDEKVDLRGVVTDEQRRPVPGAQVKWDPADEKSALLGVLLDAVRGRVNEVLRFISSPSVTDVDGHYVLRGLPVSKVKVRVTAGGYAALEQVASRGDTLDFVLKKEGGRIRGRVVDEAGHPLERFAVDGSTFTPEDGRFEVEAFSHEESLSVTAVGFSRLATTVSMDAPLQEVGDLVMKKARQLRLEVHGADGRPLEGVKVAAAQSVDGDSCTTRGDGTCVIAPLLDVQTQVKAVKDGYAPTSATVAAGQIDQLLTLTLSPAGGRIIGEAFALPGRPAAARSLFLAGAVSKSVMSDGAGHFTAEGLPEGPYCVSLDSPTVRGLEWAVRVDASATPVPVQVGPVASGGALAGSRTLPGRLVLVRGAPGPLSISAVVDPSASSLCETMNASVLALITTGEFRVEGIPPGRWSVYFVSLTQAEDPGVVQPVVVDLLPNETKSLP